MIRSQRTPTTADMIAGISVAFVAIPQALAYAEIAGMPAHTGLYATAFPALLAAFFAHSRYLQTGPVAMTALLAFGALAPLAEPKTAEYIGLAALLAILVGTVRTLLGVLRLGRIADFMSQPVILGFTTAAAILIAGSQSDKAFGVDGAPAPLFEKLIYVLTHPGEWSAVAVAVSAVTALIVVGGRRLHALFPGVLVAAVGGVVLGRTTGYPAALVGEVPSGLPSLTIALDWAAIPTLLVSAIVIAVVGFAEPTAIARTLAAQDRERWDANRELISQGVANIASGFSGAFPVGGSFSRSSVNKLAGAQTRWAGAITGLTVIAFLPFAGILATLPQAVLGSIVIVAVAKLIRIPDMIRLGRTSVPQAVVGWGTALATLLLAPRVDYAVLIGVGLSLAVHVLRESGRVSVTSSYSDDTVVLSPVGVLFFASASRFQDVLLEVLAAHPDATTLRLDLRQLGRVDYTGATTLVEVMTEATASGLSVEVVNATEPVRMLLDDLR